jgi:CysZ protein
MERVAAALLKGLASLLHPRMLWLIIWPMLVALAIWLTLAVVYWSQALTWVDLELHQWAAYRWTLSVWPLSVLATWLGWLLLIFLFVPVVLMTAVLIVSVFAMPVMVAYVGERDYPRLARRKGGTFIGSLWNAVLAVAWLALLFALTLPLWLIPIFWPALPIVLLGYFNQRVYRYDAIAEHGTPVEIAEIILRSRGELFLLGAVLALVGHLPLVGLAMPVYGGLVFIHYALARLAELRGEPIEGSARRV